jgi:hypothetical protein
VAFYNHSLRLLTALARLEEAETPCGAALACDPVRYKAHKNLGLALAGLG